MLSNDEVWRKLEEWNQVTQLGMLLQKEAYKAGLNNLSIKNRIINLGYTLEEIENSSFLKSLVDLD